MSNYPYFECLWKNTHTRPYHMLCFSQTISNKLRHCHGYHCQEMHNSRANVDTLLCTLRLGAACCVLSLVATLNNQQVSRRSLRSTIWSNRETLALCQSGQLRPEQGLDWTTQEPVNSMNHMYAPNQEKSLALLPTLGICWARHDQDANLIDQALTTA